MNNIFLDVYVEPSVIGELWLVKSNRSKEFYRVLIIFYFPRYLEGELKIL